MEKRLLEVVTLITSSILLPTGHPGRHMGHEPRPCVIVSPVSLGQFTPSLGLTLWARCICEILLPVEFHTLWCSSRTKQT